MTRTEKARRKSLRAVKAARVVPSASPSTNLAARRTVTKGAPGAIRRSTALKLTATQRNSEGRVSEWSMSPEFFTDPKWSQTVTSQR